MERVASVRRERGIEGVIGSTILQTIILCTRVDIKFCPDSTQVIATAADKKVSYRTAAFINAFNKMHGTYTDSGFTI